MERAQFTHWQRLHSLQKITTWSSQRKLDTYGNWNALATNEHTRFQLLPYTALYWTTPLMITHALAGSDPGDCSSSYCRITTAETEGRRLATSRYSLGLLVSKDRDSEAENWEYCSTVECCAVGAWCCAPSQWPLLNLAPVHSDVIRHVESDVIIRRSKGGSTEAIRGKIVSSILSVCRLVSCVCLICLGPVFLAWFPCTTAINRFSTRLSVQQPLATIIPSAIFRCCCYSTKEPQPLGCMYLWCTLYYHTP